MEFIVILKALYYSLSMKWKPGLIPRIFKSSVNDVKSLIVSFSLLLFVAVVRMELQSYKYITYMYLFPLLEVVVKCTHRPKATARNVVVIGSTVVQNTYIFFSCLPSIYQYVFLWLIVSLVLSCAGVPLLYSFFFKVFLDDLLCEARPHLQETLFDCIEGTCCSWAEK